MDCATKCNTAGKYRQPALLLFGTRLDFHIFAILLNYRAWPHFEALNWVAHRLTRAILHFDPLRSRRQTPTGRRYAVVRGRLLGSWFARDRRLLAQ